MGRLVKRAELSILGMLGIALFSYAHMPSILASLDGATSTEPAAYSASAAAAVAPYVDQTVSDPTPVTITTTPITPAQADATKVSAVGSATSTDISPETPSAPQTTDANAVLPSDNAAQNPEAYPANSSDPTAY
jgi:hypothetical protein